MLELSSEEINFQMAKVSIKCDISAEGDVGAGQTI